MKKNILKPLIIGIVMLIMLPYIGFAEETIFKDISNSYVKSEIEALYRDGILTGTGKGLFNPKGKMDRAQLAAVLVRSMKLEQDKENAKKFSDVPQNIWYAGYVGALVKTGITAGTSENTFTPDRNITRQELAVFYIRALGLENKAKELKIDMGFTDNAKIGAWAKDEVGLASYFGLISGIQNSDGTFRFDPTEEVDRELLADATYKLNYSKLLYSNIIAMLEGPEKPIEPKPVEPKPENPIKPDPVKPVEPTKPDPVKPEEPVKPVEPPKPPVDDKNESVKVANVTGKQVEFMGAYLISVEFDIIGDIGTKNVQLVINDGLSNAMKLKEGNPKYCDFYFDGMVMSIDTIILYIGNQKIDLTGMISWK